MGKLISWVVIILLVMLAARLIGRLAAKRKAQTEKTAKTVGRGYPGAGPNSAGRPPDGAAEAMARCAHCGIYLPRSEALLIGGKTWCGHDHAKQDGAT